MATITGFSLVRVLAVTWTILLVIHAVANSSVVIVNKMSTPGENSAVSAAGVNATVPIGHVGPYVESSEDFTAYAERVALYFMANDIKGDRKVPAFLTLIGSQTYALLRSLLTPELPQDSSFEELVKVLKSHYNPTPSVIVERYKFHKCYQGEDTLANFITRLKHLSTHCQFGDTLNERLRDQLVVGLKSDSIQKRLLSEPKLTYERACELASCLVTAARDTRDIKSGLPTTNTTPAAEVHKFRSRGQGSGNNTSDAPKKSCYRCGSFSHLADRCKCKDTVCSSCSKKGHLSKVCMSSHSGSRNQPLHYRKKGFGKPKPFSKKPNKSKVNSLDECLTDTCSDDEILGVLGHMFSIPDTDSSDVIWIHLNIEQRSIKMELDTGSKVSILPLKLYNEKFSHIKLQKSTLKMTTYTGEKIKPVGIMTVNVKYQDQIYEKLKLYVVKGIGPPLFGRNWLEKIQLDWNSISSRNSSNLHSVQNDTSLDNLKSKYAELFSDDLGNMKEITAKLYLKDNAKPKFMKARPVPYALQDRVHKELTRLETSGIIKKVSHSDWASPIVPVVKDDNTVRICGDFKQTVNPQLHIEQYPMQRIEDMFSTLSGGQKFTKIDLAHAYQQMSLEEESQKYLTINTTKGLFQYQRLAFGVASAPALFQAAMDQILQGIPYVLCYQDDILITGRNDDEHYANLELVLQRLLKFGLCIKLKKCVFFSDSVKYLGHVIDRDGLRTSDDKVNDIVNAPAPENVTELRSFLGLINYYGKFLKNLSTVLHPLNQLLQKKQKWNWTKKCESAFKQAKNMIISSDVLVHYDVTLPVRLACDASPYGVGSVLSHVYPDGSERPIAFASRSLTKSEKNYAQIDKEALGIIFGVKRFHSYIYARHFTLVTDHRPLTALFGPTKPIPTLAAARMQRWALILSGYSYDIQYRSSTDNANADGLSRLPIKVRSNTEDRLDSVDTLHISLFDKLPVTSANVRCETRKDCILSRVYECIMTGWPHKCHDPILQPFYSRRNEYTVHQGCILWGTKVVIPEKLRPLVLEEIHSGHLGIVRMKAVARSFVWWPHIDSDIESIANTCASCQQVKHMPPSAPVYPWCFPSGPWQRIHVDFAGPFLGHMFLLAIDAYSKFPEIIRMDKTTSSATITVVRRLFASHGLPLTLVSDNGPQFVSQDFEDFLRRNGVRHVLSAPYKPSTNGQIERLVQTFKQSMKSSKCGGDVYSVQKCLDAFLLKYRSTPHSITKETPSKLLYNRELRTRLDLLKPSLKQDMEVKQDEQITEAKENCFREFEVNQSVWIRNYGLGDKWLPGRVISKDGPRYYTVSTTDDVMCRRHLDQLRIREESVQNTENVIPKEIIYIPNTDVKDKLVNRDSIHSEIP